MYDKSEIRAGLFIEGPSLPAEMLIVKSRDQIRKPPRAPDLSAINDQLDAASKKLEEIAQAVTRSEARR